MDYEDGSAFVETSKINIKEEALKANVSPLLYLKSVADTLKQKTIENGGIPLYDFIVHDTTSAIEEYAAQLAAIKYKSTNLGKSWKGGDIKNLPNGAGYGWLREAFNTIYHEFDGLYAKGLILLGHTKTASITKQGKEVSARDIDLTGKLKQIVSADMDAIGFMYRNKEGNQNIITFKTTETDIASGARPAHLKNQEFVLSELLEDNTITTHWGKIFTSLN